MSNELKTWVKKKKTELEQRTQQLPDTYTPENYAESMAIRREYKEVAILELDFLTKKEPEKDDEELLY